MANNDATSAKARLSRTLHARPLAPPRLLPAPSQASGLRVNRAVAVDRRMATSDPNIFACGDCAECEGAFVPSWPNALAQGTVAGQAAAGVPDAQFLPESTPFYLEGFGIKVDRQASASRGVQGKEGGDNEGEGDLASFLWLIFIEAVVRI